jgi:hypothetical protein
MIALGKSFSFFLGVLLFPILFITISEILVLKRKLALSSQVMKTLAMMLNIILVLPWILALSRQFMNTLAMTLD